MTVVSPVIGLFVLLPMGGLLAGIFLAVRLARRR